MVLNLLIHKSNRHIYINVIDSNGNVVTNVHTNEPIFKNKNNHSFYSFKYLTNKNISILTVILKHRLSSLGINHFLFKNDKYRYTGNIRIIFNNLKSLY